MNPTPTPTTEDRAGLMLAAHLDQGLQDLGPDIAERLRFARERALARARLSRRLAAAMAPAWSAGAGLALAGAGGRLSGTLGGLSPAAPGTTGSWWTKLVSALPLLILALGFLAIQDTLAERQVRAAAEVDAALLTDDLPPQAYADPGFAEFLRRLER
jgi:hypothetical protein